MAISREQKEQMVADCADKLSRSNAIFLTDYRGLTVSEMESLRAKIREAGGGHNIVKNTLAARALEAASLPVPEDMLNGPTAISYAFEEVPALAKALEDFAKETIDQEDMNYRQLNAYVDKVRKRGGNVDKYLVDLHFKFSFPLAGFIFVILGIAFASGKRKPSMATGFGLTLAISFIYYGFLRVGQTLGHNGVLQPALAAQLGNILFLAVGIYALARANR